MQNIKALENFSSTSIVKTYVANRNEFSFECHFETRTSLSSFVYITDQTDCQPHLH